MANHGPSDGVFGKFGPFAIGVGRKSLPSAAGCGSCSFFKRRFRMPKGSKRPIKRSWWSRKRFQHEQHQEMVDVKGSKRIFFLFFLHVFSMFFAFSLLRAGFNTNEYYPYISNMNRFAIDFLMPGRTSVAVVMLLIHWSLHYSIHFCTSI